MHLWKTLTLSPRKNQSCIKRFPYFHGPGPTPAGVWECGQTRCMSHTSLHRPATLGRYQSLITSPNSGSSHKKPMVYAEAKTSNPENGMRCVKTRSPGRKKFKRAVGAENRFHAILVHTPTIFRLPSTSAFIVLHSPFLFHIMPRRGVRRGPSSRSMYKLLQMKRPAMILFF